MIITPEQADVAHEIFVEEKINQGLIENPKGGTYFDLKPYPIDLENSLIRVYKEAGWIVEVIDYRILLVCRTEEYLKTLKTSFSK